MNDSSRTFPRRRALIAGAGGVVGAALARALVEQGWSVVGLSRNPLDVAGVDVVSVDLFNPQDCEDKLAELTDITHVYFAARYSFSEGGREPQQENLTILKNLVEVLDRVAPDLQHIHLVQGSKYYGSHVGPVVTPMKEHYPRSLVPNFYYLQQDYLTDKQRSARWAWSVSRPDALVSAQEGAARNLASVIFAYALICRELEQPFCFPGTPAAYDALYQCTSADHLAAGITWMSVDPRAANQAFNLVNGDYFRWSTLWAAFARYFDLPLGPVRTMKLTEAMADKGPVWTRMMQRADASPVPLENVAAWEYADYIWSRSWDVMSDMTKARLHGFNRTVDTEAEFQRFFDQLNARLFAVRG